jgi:hypothetical protein
MTVALDQDLLGPMLAGWQKVADCYGLRAHVFRAAGKIFAVTNEEQGFGELVTIIEPPLARAVRSAYCAARLDRKTPESPLRFPRVEEQARPGHRGRWKWLAATIRTSATCATPNLASAQIFADLDQNDLHPRPAHNSNSAEQM